MYYHVFLGEVERPTWQAISGRVEEDVCVSCCGRADKPAGDTVMESPGAGLFQLATSGLETYVYSILSKHLSDFLHLSRDQFNISAWEGEAVLESVRVRKGALLGMPFRVRSGHARRIRVRVPWHALKSEPVRIFVEGLTLYVKAEGTAEAAWAARQTSAQESRTGGEQQRGGSSTPTSSVGDDSTSMGYFERASNALLANITVHVRDCRIYFEGAQEGAAAGRSFVASVLIQVVQLYPTDANWQSAFVSPADVATRRRLDLAGLSITFREPAGASAGQAASSRQVTRPGGGHVRGLGSGTQRDGLRSAEAVRGTRGSSLPGDCQQEGDQVQGQGGGLEQHSCAVQGQRPGHQADETHAAGGSGGSSTEGVHCGLSNPGGGLGSREQQKGSGEQSEARWVDDGAAAVAAAAARVAGSEAEKAAARHVIASAEEGEAVLERCDTTLLLHTTRPEPPHSLDAQTELWLWLPLLRLRMTEATLRHLLTACRGSLSFFAGAAHPQSTPFDRRIWQAEDDFGWWAMRAQLCASMPANVTPLKPQQPPQPLARPPPAEADPGPRSAGSRQSTPTTPTVPSSRRSTATATAAAELDASQGARPVADRPLTASRDRVGSASVGGCAGSGDAADRGGMAGSLDDAASARGSGRGGGCGPCAADSGGDGRCGASPSFGAGVCLHVQLVKKGDAGKLPTKLAKEAQTLASLTGRVRAEPDVAEHYHERAKALLGMGLHSEAVRDASSCLQLDPALSRAHFAKGRALYFLEEFEAAFAQYDAGLRLEPHPQIAAWLDEERRKPEYAAAAQLGPVALGRKISQVGPLVSHAPPEEHGAQRRHAATEAAGT